MTGKIIPVLFGAALGLAAPAPAQDVAARASAGPATSPAMAPPDVVTVRNITRVELTPGLPIVDDSGAQIGTVKKVAGNTIVITDGTADYKVPITQLYAYRKDAADHFASRLPKSVLEREE
ncbi:hypothetical protein [Novosphingobium malaysiense]|uniref:PRC-barrel domain-containing protein n=1 Tax=Novosphingobium malaysiense TaxID=1348853 RepID=A0A0B1ZFW0_9SPHN|nr:hypothetical protein [Novosphingobium malaysiense]KHK89395.1 hypothetical protein LK12_19880 [Novosphingobium malaysiense]